MPVMSRRRTRSRPARGRTTPPIAAASDDFPAPFAPSTAVTDPCARRRRRRTARGPRRTRPRDRSDAEHVAGAVVALGGRDVVLRPRCSSPRPVQSTETRVVRRGRRPGPRGCADFVGQTLRSSLAEVEHGDTVGELEHELDVVLDEHEGDAPLVAHPAQRFARAVRSRARRDRTTVRRAASREGSEASARATSTSRPVPERHRRRRDRSATPSSPSELEDRVDRFVLAGARTARRSRSCRGGSPCRALRGPRARAVRRRGVRGR